MKSIRKITVGAHQCVRPFRRIGVPVDRADTLVRPYDGLYRCSKFVHIV